VIDRRKLTLFYRNVELIRGFPFDLCLVNEIGRRLGIEWSSLSFHAVHSEVYCPKVSPFKKLYYQLHDIFQ